MIKAIRAKLLTDGGITSLVTGIYSPSVPQETARPYITVAVDTTDQKYCKKLSGNSEVTRSDATVTVYADTIADREEITEAIAQLLDIAAPTTWGERTIHRSNLLLYTDSEDFKDDFSENLVYIKEIDFDIIHN